MLGAMLNNGVKTVLLIGCDKGQGDLRLKLMVSSV